MYIPIGEDFNIRDNDIIFILDKDSANQSNLVSEFLQFHQDKLINLSKHPFKSIIITYDKIYLSPFASGTLMKRSNQFNIQVL